MQQRKNEMSQGQEAGNNGQEAGNNNDWTNDAMEENHPVQHRQPVIEQQSVRPSLSLQATPPPRPSSYRKPNLINTISIKQDTFSTDTSERLLPWKIEGNFSNFTMTLFPAGANLAMIKISAGFCLPWRAV